jgi:hypothetical protein
MDSPGAPPSRETTTGCTCVGAAENSAGNGLIRTAVRLPYPLAFTTDRKTSAASPSASEHGWNITDERAQSFTVTGTATAHESWLRCALDVGLSTREGMNMPLAR